MPRTCIPLRARDDRLTATAWDLQDGHADPGFAFKPVSAMLSEREVDRTPTRLTLSRRKSAEAVA